jgi:hypothetical protein
LSHDNLHLDPRLLLRVRLDGDALLRSTLLLATFLLIRLTPTPFPDLSDPKLLEPAGEGNLFGQSLVILLAVAVTASRRAAAGRAR